MFLTEKNKAADRKVSAASIQFGSVGFQTLMQITEWRSASPAYFPGSPLLSGLAGEKPISRLEPVRKAPGFRLRVPALPVSCRDCKCLCALQNYCPASPHSFLLLTWPVAYLSCAFCG